MFRVMFCDGEAYDYEADRFYVTDNGGLCFEDDEGNVVAAVAAFVWEDVSATPDEEDDEEVE